MLTPLDSALRRRVPGGPVVITRVMLGLALALVSLESGVALAQIAEGSMTYPFFDRVPHPTRTAATAVLMLGWLAAVCLVLGLLPDLMALLGSGLGLVTLLWDQQLYSSHLTLLTILLALLAFAEADRRRGLSRKRHRNGTEVPWWPQLLMMTQVSVVYLFAGLSKAQPTFLSGEPLQGWMRPELPLVVFAVLAWGTVVTEVFLAVALWVPRLRRLAVATGVVLHLSIVMLLDGENLWLLAFALTTMATYPLFLSRPLVLRRDQAVSPAARGVPAGSR